MGQEVCVLWAFKQKSCAYHLSPQTCSFTQAEITKIDNPNNPIIKNA